VTDDILATFGIIHGISVCGHISLARILAYSRTHVLVCPPTGLSAFPFIGGLKAGGGGGWGMKNATMRASAVMQLVRCDAPSLARFV